MVNIEASSLRRFNRIALQGKKSYNFFSVISRFYAFGGLLAMSLTQPTVDFSHGYASVNVAIHQCIIKQSTKGGTPIFSNDVTDPKGGTSICSNGVANPPVKR